MSFSLLRIALFALALLVNLVGCGSRTEQSPQDTNTVSGNAVKGVISHGIINAFRIESDGSYSFLSTTRTGANGRFEFELNTEPDALLLLELKADEYSRMTCDLLNGCVMPGTGDLAEFGEDFALPEQFSLLGIKLPDTQQAFLSPLSHIVATTAAGLDGGMTLQNVQVASEWVQTDLKLDGDPLVTETPDITSLQNPLSDAELNQGIMGASFFYYAFQNEWQSHTLTLDDLALSDIFNAAADLAENLSYHYAGSSSDTSRQLASISSEQQSNADQFETNALSILAQPQSISIVEGEAVSLRVTASSDNTISYQWYKNNALIQGATEQVLSIAAAALTDQGLYHVRVSDGESELQSLSAQVNVHAAYVPLQISTHPQSQSLSPGQTLTLSVETTGGSGEISYQWRKGGSIIPGATSDSLSVSNVSAQDEGSYSVTLSDGNRTLESQAAVINVTEVILPVTIHQHPQAISVISGQSVTLNVNASGGGYIGYQWRKGGVALAGANAAYLTINPVQGADEGAYDVIVSNSQGSVISNSAQLVVIPEVAPIVILNHPQSVSAMLGESASFSVSATSGDTITYQWFHNAVAIPGANTSVLTIDPLGLDDAGIYHVVLESGSQSETSFSAVLDIETLASVELSWDIPTQRENGQALSLNEIQGYRIQYGSLPYSLDNNLQVNGATNTQLTVPDLLAGTYYFRIATIDSDGLTGAYSSAISLDLY